MIMMNPNIGSDAPWPRLQALEKFDPFEIYTGFVFSKFILDKIDFSLSEFYTG